MENLIELSEKELKEINGGRLPFPTLNRFNFFWDVAKAGWSFGKYLAG
ncbi:MULTISPECIES: bacteriocin [Tenacibaculum]|uniref:Bacteriocin-type signal sequence n=1 Tax=Tenacibaculum finnmarkense genomovar ulcerans TaxID=2781388 RepID=A0A2I2M7X4_9FLAO|nr:MULTISPECIES: bacteriocin [Tenacibaculum]MBE7697178.1 bacteriocin [Tenacibaculum finnmarkense genomovar ulcerans]MCD8422116.1 bacteriocin [Tenacibaculum finnmarkense genomovar ulcerans]MCG8239159.1 bacteriocin [Tenacibaculum finnmarkense genomovar ulcerans]MCG8801880.1 bacteriocin [Tenacibaculum finnmarkense]MCG8824609.1 bacteriocin [Tenacibaculum finnmarkense]